MLRCISFLEKLRAQLILDARVSLRPFPEISFHFKKLSRF